ncbi:MAG: UDP-N-acetylglucosamine--N-acetylmuramyl-(pentapeptide) pyrophosphoryl-undecaprenol N-acetylglucosamine transferase [Alphaproteobacteria bacterium MarineAlpha4_Bin2]|nr:MAG: UDP-N-acetylglucosamine--N-acetylmuramyl-(pentapeptide) pyrophosphoryl-undecaprenol N-acetylglucosamine transferase [Alphaproteobacteria bacterium MarineAlpha4_Bin2]
MSELRLIVLAAGGTGGHIFPAQALAAELRGRGYRLAIMSDHRSQAFDGVLGELEAYRIDAAGVSGKGYLAKAAALLRLTRGYLQARRLLRRIDPVLVVGFGSYPSAPTVLAAQHLGLKTLIHEQNAVLGRANRLLARKATRVATAFEIVRELRAADRRKSVCTGNPVRPEFVSARDRPYAPPSADGDVDLLVVGGSQGAKILGEIVPQALAMLEEALRVRVRVTLQCREEGIGLAKRDLRHANVRAEVASFFDDIPERFVATALVICRSGASTVAELTAVGRPALLVPFPHATDDHQTANAVEFCDAGGGWIVQQNALSPETLAERLEFLLKPGPTLAVAASCARQIGKPEAAERLADLVAEILDGNGDLANRREIAA